MAIPYNRVDISITWAATVTIFALVLYTCQGFFNCLNRIFYSLNSKIESVYVNNYGNCFVILKKIF